MIGAYAEVDQPPRRQSCTSVTELSIQPPHPASQNVPSLWPQALHSKNSNTRLYQSQSFNLLNPFHLKPILSIAHSTKKHDYQVKPNMTPTTQNRPSVEWNLIPLYPTPYSPIHQARFKRLSTTRTHTSHLRTE